jgi:hypothetical protein
MCAYVHARAPVHMRVCVCVCTRARGVHVRLSRKDCDSEGDRAVTVSVGSSTDRGNALATTCNAPLKHEYVSSVLHALPYVRWAVSCKADLVSLFAMLFL